jgi:hypothetical protein
MNVGAPPDWIAFRAARDRFFAQVRPEAMEQPARSPSGDVVPEESTHAYPDGDREPGSTGHSPARSVE